MAARRRFIDKRNAVTYQLFYEGSEEDGGGGENPSTAGVRRQFVRCDDNYHVDDSAWYGEDEGEEPPELQRNDEAYEKRRREIIELGFPDDGYDYLQHVRAPGAGASASPAVLSDPHDKPKGQLKVHFPELETAVPRHPGAGIPNASAGNKFLQATAARRNVETDVSVVDATRWSLPAAAEDEGTAWAHAAGLHLMRDRKDVTGIRGIQRELAAQEEPEHSLHGTGLV